MPRREERFISVHILRVQTVTRRKWQEWEAVGCTIGSTAGSRAKDAGADLSFSSSFNSEALFHGMALPTFREQR